MGRSCGSHSGPSFHSMSHSKLSIGEKMVQPPQDRAAHLAKWKLGTTISRIPSAAAAAAAVISATAVLEPSAQPHLAESRAAAAAGERGSSAGFKPQMQPVAGAVARAPRAAAAAAAMEASPLGKHHRRLG